MDKHPLFDTKTGKPLFDTVTGKALKDEKPSDRHWQSAKNTQATTNQQNNSNSQNTHGNQGNQSNQINQTPNNIATKAQQLHRHIVHRNSVIGGVVAACAVLGIGVALFASAPPSPSRVNINKVIPNHKFTADKISFHNMGITCSNVTPNKNVYQGAFDSDSNNENGNFSRKGTFYNGNLVFGNNPSSNNSDSDGNRLAFSTTKHTLTISDVGSNNSDNNSDSNSPIGDYVKFKFNHIDSDGNYVFYPYSVLNKRIHSIPTHVSNSQASDNPLIIKTHGKV